MKRIICVVALLLLSLSSMASVNASAATLTKGSDRWVMAQLPQPATPQPTAEATAQATPDPNQAPSEQDLENFYQQMWQQIGDKYYNIDALKNWGSWLHKYDGKLKTVADLEQALKEMAASLGDRWTSYTSHQELVDGYNQYQSGTYGLGLALKPSASGWVVDYVEWAGPAFKADIRRGDQIDSIGGTQIGKLEQLQVDALLNSPAGTPVVFVDHHNGITDSITVISAAPATAAVESTVYPGKVAYIRLPDFDDQQLLSDFITQLKQLYTGSTPRALVFDLRGNPGGKVSEAITIVSIFMRSGVIMKDTTRSGRVTTGSLLTVTAPLFASDILTRIEATPLFVMVDENSASAAELTTGAFKDNHRAVILGQRTWGKGVGYEEFGPDPKIMPTGGLLRITTLSLVTPSGFSVQGKGIKPNIVISQPRGHTTDVQLQNALTYITAAIN